MPRVASEASVSAQVGASQTRAGKQPSRGKPDLFAQLLPETDAAPAPADHRPAQISKPVGTGEAVAPGSKPQDKPAQMDEQGAYPPAADSDNAALVFVAEAAQVIVETVAPSPLAPVISTPAALPGPTPPADGIPEAPTPAAAPAPIEAPVSAPVAGPAAATPTRPAITTPAAQAPVLPVTAPAPASIPETTPAPTAATPAPTATPNAAAATPTPGTPATTQTPVPFPVPATPSASPATAPPTPAVPAAATTVPARHVAEPAILDAAELPKIPRSMQGIGPAPAKPNVAATADAAEEPVPLPDSTVPVSPKPSIAVVGKAQPPTAASGASITAVKPFEGEPAGPAAAAATEANPEKPATTRQGPAPAPMKVNGHPDASAPAPNPVSPSHVDLPTPEFKLSAPLDLASATIQPVPQSHPAAPPSSPAMQPVAAAPVPLAGLPVVLAANAQSGNSRFEIRLDPPELGRIDVRLHFHADGQVTSHLIVDRSETLDLLRRDAADLERSLQQAGLKTSDQGMQFTLRDQSQHGDQNERGHRGAAHVVVHEQDAAADIATRGYTRAGQGAGIDIRV